ncbi:SDR family oxidoreductase [Microbispora bryophytorum]|uniref:SDR family NAD(P)-dependent oxidoreductase n=1 Tax=Microbispora bryophytorum TaxID=1460882 RepID=UPI0033CDE443
MTDARGFENRVAFVTGAGNGIGREMARDVVRQGGKVAIADVDLAAAETAAAELGDAAMAVLCDVADEQSVQTAVDAAAERLGGIDVLVNNAGLHLMKWNVPVTSVTAEQWHQILGVNVVGVVNCARSARPYLARGKGPAILNLSSIAGYLSNTVYGITKLGVRGLTVALAEEFAPDGIRVNAVAPGAIGSDNAIDELSGQLRVLIDDMQLIHRMGRMADIVRPPPPPPPPPPPLLAAASGRSAAGQAAGGPAPGRTRGRTRGRAPVMRGCHAARLSRPGSR